MYAEAFAAFLIVVGGLFVLLGSIALIRLPDIFTRLHGPTKATTLGVGAIVIASSVAGYALTGEVSMKELAVSLFLFITAPVSAHLLAKAAQKYRSEGRG
ncbi:MAG: Na+/H+ antiporter subunit G [Hyphomicrobium sp. 32-62-53]|nr:MAG: Na+/H+ antiporter subunit G [Hyphomicrobium sp. 12-62-95]OYX99207.1 MAG: Na+/H+ antiporter subunit G [Hyphomicrobium sp. 32-62-53]